jgi:hypothetical protein
VAEEKEAEEWREKFGGRGQTHAHARTHARTHARASDLGSPRCERRRKGGPRRRGQAGRGKPLEIRLLHRAEDHVEGKAALSPRPLFRLLHLHRRHPCTMGSRCRHRSLRFDPLTLSSIDDSPAESCLRSRPSPPPV